MLSNDQEKGLREWAERPAFAAKWNVRKNVETLLDENEQLRELLREARAAADAITKAIGGKPSLEAAADRMFAQLLVKIEEALADPHNSVEEQE